MIAIGSDHGGYQLKEKIKKYLEEKDIEYKDYGTNSEERTDYPIYAKKVAEAIQNGEADKGILICRSGFGMTVVANKFKGIRAAVYVFAEPNIDIIDKENPKKFDPVSPKKVLAGEKLYGKNPTKAPAKAVIKTIDTIDEPFNTNIINNDTADITDIPDDKPSNPSIKFIAFVTITIHTIVKITDITSCISGKFRNGNVIPSIVIPDNTTIIAANNCPVNFVRGFIVFVSSITQKIANIIIAIKNPINFFAYCSTPNKFIVFSNDITINKYIVDTKKPSITAGPPNLGIVLLCVLLLSFGISSAPIFFAIFIVYGVATNATTNASINAMAISPHILIPPISYIYFILFLSISSNIFNLSSYFPPLNSEANQFLIIHIVSFSVK